MNINIPRIIDEQEILVRFIFEKNFKNKKIEITRINDGDVFLDLRGVSLQREKYCNETKCKKLAKDNRFQKYIGFAVFRLKHFNKTLEEHKTSRPDFEARLISTPLDINLEIISSGIEINTKTLGLPAHADIEYLNPALIDDETPKIALRKFSRNLFKKSVLIIDKEPLEEEFSLIPFRKII
jgi:hypothetical protein